MGSCAERLAATFRAFLTPPMNARLPLLLNARHYDGRQEDAEEFLRKMLFADDCEPEVTRLCHTQMQSFLICKRCDMAFDYGGPENVDILQLPLHAHGHLYTSIAQALAALLVREEVDRDLEAWRAGCAVCSSTESPWRQARYTVAPEVLLIQLKRWSSHRAADVLLHKVHPEATITFADATYNLVSVVSHIGHSAHHGHYTATIKYTTTQGDWWYYNDAHSSLTISPADVLRDEEHIYLALYEKQN